MNASRRSRLIAFFMPLAGLLLIMPPFVFLFDRPATLFGVPGIIVFLFAVWLAMIVGTYFVQKSLRTPQEERSGNGDKP